MASCVQLNADGTLTPTGQTVDECTGYVMVSGSEYAVYQLVQSALATPTHEQVAGIMSLGFFMPVALYMVARLGAKVAGMFDGW
jgi:hypothetical protein